MSQHCLTPLKPSETAVYAVLPLSLAFLVLFSFGSQRFSRATLFYVIICTFLTFFVAFALLYPHHQVHPLPPLLHARSDAGMIAFSYQQMGILRCRRMRQ